MPNLLFRPIKDNEMDHRVYTKLINTSDKLHLKMTILKNIFNNPRQTVTIKVAGKPEQKKKKTKDGADKRDASLSCSNTVYKQSTY